MIPLFHDSSFDDSSVNIPPDFDNSIRRVTHEGQDYFSLIDVMAFFTESKAVDQYWRDTKKRLEADGFETKAKIFKLPIISKKDGSLRKTDCANGNDVLRIVQSIPSPKAEPIRQWLADLGYERIEELANPGLGLDRAAQREYNRLIASGMTHDEVTQWIDTRVKQRTQRLKITDIWKDHGATGYDYVTLSNTVMLEAVGKTATQLKRELQVANPRDHLSAAENATVAGIELFAGMLHGGRSSQGVNQLTEDIKDSSDIIDRDKLNAAFSKKRPNQQ